jgi:mRNA interferase MazF
VVVQSNAFNRSRLATVVCVPLTTNLRLAAAPGNVWVARAESGLDRDSVANVSALVAVDRSILKDRVGPVPEGLLTQIMAGIDVVLGR